MDKLPPLTEEELTELRDFAKAEGRRWKDEILYGYWMKGIPVRDRKGRQYHHLYGLRNSHGPSWLNDFRLPKD